MSRKSKIRQEYLIVVIGILLGIILILNSSLNQNAIAQPAVWHPLSQVTTDGLNTLDDNMDDKIDAADIEQGAGSGLDADSVDSIQGNIIWTQNNDGAGSGLDADFLDTYDSSDFLQAISTGGGVGVLLLLLSTSLRGM